MVVKSNDVLTASIIIVESQDKVMTKQVTLAMQKVQIVPAIINRPDT